jgi:ribulose-5-phosphate 4-epimerase/fuculose-1-phosphate aldolase
LARDLASIRREVAVANRILADVGLASGVLASLGHASLRLPDEPDRFAVKGRGYALDALAVMQPDDMVVCDLDGFKVEGRPELSPPSEVKMHSCIYRARPDVMSVVHVHPRFTTVMGILQSQLRPMCLEGMHLVNKPLPVFESPRLIITEEDGREVAQTLGDSHAIILQGHGAATVGANLEESFMTMFQLEEQARMNWYAYCAAGPDHAYTRPEKVAEHAKARQLIPEQAHLKPETPRTGPPAPGGVWAYLTHLASGQMDNQLPNAN